MESSKSETINNVSSERNQRKIDKNRMNLSRIGSAHDLGSNLEVSNYELSEYQKNSGMSHSRIIFPLFLR